MKGICEAKTKISKAAKKQFRDDLLKQREELGDALDSMRVAAIRDAGLDNVFQSLAYEALRDTEFEDMHDAMLSDVYDLDRAIRFAEANA